MRQCGQASGPGFALEISLAEPGGVEAVAGWGHFSCAASSGTDKKVWRARIHTALAAAVPRPLPPGPVAVQLAWRCSKRCNGRNLWKKTGEMIGPMLGEAPGTRFNPRDDRIVSLVLHLNLDPTMGYDVDVGMWWRAVLQDHFA